MPAVSRGRSRTAPPMATASWRPRPGLTGMVYVINLASRGVAGQVTGGIDPYGAAIVDRDIECRIQFRYRLVPAVGQGCLLPIIDDVTHGLGCPFASGPMGGAGWSVETLP
jgi:hypothetical protein